MFKNTKAFSSFSVNDIAKTKQFYGETLGLNITEDKGLLTIQLEGGGRILVYLKKDHLPASFTILNFSVSDIKKTLKDLVAKGISFERYANTDQLGISHNEGSLIAWFKDPSGNFLSVVEDVRIEDKVALVKGKVEVTKLISSGRENIFTAWIRPDLLEKWYYPEGMKLVVETLEYRVGGKFRYKNFGNEGEFISTGTFKEIIPNEKLEYFVKVNGPGDIALYDTILRVEFRSLNNGTEINVTQTGFTEQNGINSCKRGWTESLENLSKLFSSMRGQLGVTI
ncbi:MAG: SRPBCC domain-containing protein [Bacteriovorax sp.]|nr:SRPBCC domain-containing protein [Bacteriovorax sp.]